MDACCCISRNGVLNSIVGEGSPSIDSQVSRTFRNARTDDQANVWPITVKKCTEIDSEATQLEIYRTVQKITDHLLTSSRASQVRRMLPLIEKEYKTVLSMKVCEGTSQDVTYRDYLEAFIRKGVSSQDPRDLCLYFWAIVTDSDIPMASKREVIHHTIDNNYSREIWCSHFYKLPVEIAMPILQCLSPIQESWDPSVIVARKFGKLPQKNKQEEPQQALTFSHKQTKPFLGKTGLSINRIEEASEECKEAEEDQVYAYEEVPSATIPIVGNLRKPAE